MKMSLKQLTNTKCSHLIARIQNIFFIALFTALFLRQSVQCLIRFFTEETNVSLEFQSSSEVTFPGITLCPAYEIAYKIDFLNKKGIQIDNFRRNFTFPNGTTNLTDFYYASTYNLNELMLSYEVNTTLSTEKGTSAFFFTFATNKTGGGTRKEILDIDLNQFIEKHYNTYGRCFSYNIPMWLRQLRVVSIEFQLLISSHVFIHHPGQFSHTDSKSKLVVSSGDSFSINVNHELTYSLSRKLKNSTGSFYMTCKEDLNEGYDNCINTEVSQRMIDKYECFVPFFPYFGSNGSSLQECKINTWKTEKLNWFRDTFLVLYQEGVRNDVCIQPCATMSITYGYASIEKLSPQTRIKLFFRNNIQVCRSEYSYTALSLLADLGGYIGLLLGYSCRNIIAIFDHILKQPSKTQR